MHNIGAPEKEGGTRLPGCRHNDDGVAGWMLPSECILRIGPLILKLSEPVVATSAQLLLVRCNQRKRFMRYLQNWGCMALERPSSNAMAAPNNSFSA
jgi:hypothetical protein